MSANKKIVSSSRLPSPIGPYSQAVIGGDTIWCSGQLPLNPQTGKIVGDTAAEQAVQVLENIRALLEDAGSSLAKVVHATIYLSDIGNFAAVNEVYARYFPTDAPARSTMEVSALPRDVKVEIEVTALAG